MLSQRLRQLERRNCEWRDRRAPDMSTVYVSGEGDPWYSGDYRPKVMIIGEAPGAQEEIKRRPFVGPAGRVLRDLMVLAEIYTGAAPHFGTPNCWLTNVVKFRPPRNRTPSLPEIMSVRQHLRFEWDILGRPSVVIAVGSVALTALAGRPMSVLRRAGQPITHTTREQTILTVWPMIHPAYALRNLSVQPVVEGHWEKLGTWLQSKGVV